MTSARRKTIATMFLTVVVVGLIIALAEGYGHYNYSVWKKTYAADGDWYGFLTQPSENPGLLWEYRPNFERRGIRTNQYGFRDIAFDLDKANGTRRIAFFGDSVALGLSVPFESTFVRRLAAHAESNHIQPKTEFLNFSVDGYNAEQIVESMRINIKRFKPDVAVYLMCLNDIDLGGSMNEKVRYFVRPSSFIFEKMERALLRYFFVDDFINYFFFRYKSRFLDAIQTMHDVARAKDIEFHVVIVPVLNFGPQTVLYPYAALHEKIGRVLTSRAINHLDLLQAFAEQDVGAGHWNLDIWHLNERGHSLVSASLQSLLFKSD